MTTIDKNTTIFEAKNQLRENWLNGIECPCCGQFVKLYRRKITSAAAAGLISLYKKGGADRFIHCNDFAYFHGGDFGKLRYWNLIVQEVNMDTKKRTSGLWKMTDTGVRFVQNRLELPKYALVYNQIFYGFKGEKVRITDCLTNGFNYAELMAPN